MNLYLKYLNFRTRLTRWEYWPFEIVYFPIFLYWLWLSLRSRSFFFFSAANPAIESGGMLGESKFSILEKIEDRYKPRTRLVRMAHGSEAALTQICTGDIGFPLIAKPDVGERGWRVARIHDVPELVAYVNEMKADFLIQEYVDYELELGVFYYRFPDQPRGVVSSIVVKEFLTLAGDGNSTLQQLIMDHARARLQYATLVRQYASELGQVPAAGEKRLLVSIGNHCLGTKFLNGNHLINQQLTDVFDRISHPIEGFHYGRYDIRCRSLDELYRGEGIRIMELNGVGAEPAHIYDPDFPFLKAYQVLFHHWSVMYRISRANYRRGTAYMTLRQGLESMNRLKNYRKLMKA